MKALTLWQPWASLIACGAKTIETRSWSTSYRGPLAIHAAAKSLSREIKRDYYGIQPHAAWQSGLVHGPVGALVCNILDAAGYEAADGSDLPLGAVVATCTLVDVVPMIAEGGPGCGPQDPSAIVLGPRCGARLWRAGEGTGGGSDISAQLPVGDFAPGRFAWLLDVIVPLAEPVPARGRQQLWEWTP